MRCTVQPGGPLPIVCLALIGSVLFTGCPPGQTEPDRITQVAELKEQLIAKSRLVEERDRQIRNMAAQIRTLSSLPDEVRSESVPRVQRIELASMSGGYDDDHDGIDEGIVVYLRPIDQDGDTIKAAGTVQVDLLDLSNTAEVKLVGQSALGAAELRKCWYGRISPHYTIKVPWADGAARAPAEKIMARVQFTEYLFGETFDLLPSFDVSGSANGG